MKKRIVISFTLIFSFFAFGSGVATYNLVTTTSNLKTLLGLHEIEDIRQDLNLSVQRVQSYVTLQPPQFSKNIDEIVKNVLKMEQAVAKCQTCHHEAAIQQELEGVQKLAADFEQALSYVITTAQDGKWRQANQKKALQAGDVILVKVQEMVNRAAFTLQRRTDRAMDRIDRSYHFLVLTILLTFLLSFIIAHLLTRKVTRPIEELLVGTRKIGAGELGYQTSFEAEAEFRELFQAFDEMSRALAAKDRENKGLYRQLEEQLQKLRETQRQLIEAEKFTALGTMAGGIAHDFNNILTGIIGNIGLLKLEYSHGREEAEILDTIETAGMRAADLVKQLLTFARHERWQMTPVKINSCISAVVELLKGTMHRRISFDLDLAPDLPELQGNPARLEQVIMNLCINARDAMPHGGTIFIRSAALSLMEEGKAPYPEARAGEYVVVLVTDTGPGIMKEILPRVFEPFFTTKPIGEGTGLGMAMVHGIVKSHQGFCRVENVRGKGARISVFLPVRTGDAPSGAMRAGPSSL